MTEFYLCIHSTTRSPEFEVWDGPFPSMEEMKACESYKAIAKQLREGDEAVREMFYMKITPGQMPYIGDF